MKNINPRKDKKSREGIIKALENAKTIYSRPFTGREFDSVTKYCKHATVFKYFRTWSEALDEIGLKR